jgi:hypothetical protein
MGSPSRHSGLWPSVHAEHRAKRNCHDHGQFSAILPKTDRDHGIPSAEGAGAASWSSQKMASGATASAADARRRRQGSPVASTCRGSLDGTGQHS